MSEQIFELEKDALVYAIAELAHQAIIAEELLNKLTRDSENIYGYAWVSPAGWSHQKTYIDCQTLLQKNIHDLNIMLEDMRFALNIMLQAEEKAARSITNSFQPVAHSEYDFKAMGWGMY